MACHQLDIRPSLHSKRCFLLLPITIFLFLFFAWFPSIAQSDLSLKNTLPKSGRMVHDKPMGKGWVNLLASADEWNFEPAYWKLNNNLFHGELGKEPQH